MLLLVSIIILGSCKMLEIHLVPHTHLDMGWLRTLDDYYWGCDNGKADVHLIISEMVASLSADGERKGILAEVGFLKRWWDNQPDSMREAFRRVLLSGQLEIVNGGWSMADEACPTYHDLLDNFIVAHQFLYDHFNYVPQVGYQIDPFGHSAFMGSLFKSLNYTGVVLTRIHHVLKEKLKDEGDLELSWHPFEEKEGIFTHIQYNHYSSPSMLYYDGLYTKGQNFIPDENSPCFNAKEVMRGFARLMKDYSVAYDSHRLLVLIGDDFTLSSAEKTFARLDLLIEYAKNHPEYGLSLQYSTVSEYFEDAKDRNSLRTFQGDFFPYADFPYSYWSGYYTSRPDLKLFIRKASNFLRISERLLAHYHIIQDKINDFQRSLEEMREYIALLQHHDAITGTAVNEVYRDYKRELYNVENRVMRIWRHIFSQKVVYKCDVYNNSTCSIINDEDFKNENVNLILFNSGYAHISETISVPINHYQVKIEACEGGKVEYDIIQEEPVVSKYSGKKYVLIVYVSMESLSVKCLKISRDVSASYKTYFPMSLSKIKNNEYTIRFLRNKFTIVSDYEITFELTYEYYNGNLGDSESNQSSGMYIFRPGFPNQESNSLCKFDQFKVIKTDLLDRYILQCENWGYSQVTLYKKSGQFPEFIHTINSIKEYTNIEIVIRYSTDWYASQFFTDSNSFRPIERTWNHLGNEKYIYEETTAGNYYPISKYIGIKDKELFGIIVDRSQGGTVRQSGSIEIMVLRKCLKDDGRGVNSSLIETNDIGEHLSIQTKHIIATSEEMLELEDSPLQTIFSRDFKESSYKIHLQDDIDLKDFNIHLRVKSKGIFSLRLKCSESNEFPISQYVKAVFGERKLRIYESNIQETIVGAEVTQAHISCSRFSFKSLEIRTY